MTVRALILTVLAAVACATTTPGLLHADFVEPIAMAAASQAPQPPPPPAQAGRGRPAQPAPPAPPAAPTARSRSAADEPPPPPPPPPVGAGRVTAPRPEGKSINIRVDATITDQQGTTAPVKKTISVVVADGANGSVRTFSTFPNAIVGNVPLNMDAETRLLADGKIRLSLRLQYDLPSPAMLGRPAGGEERQPMKTSIVEALNVVIEDGKAMVAAQSADPVSDRQVVLEIKATVLR